MEQSKEVFLRDGFHQEMFFFVTEDGNPFVMPSPRDLGRDEMAEKLRQAVREQNVYGVVHLAESWMYNRQHARDHTMRQILEGEMKVPELRPEDRTEALVVMMESREGAHFMWVTPILRVGRKVTLGETISFPEQSKGRFAGLFEKD